MLAGGYEDWRPTKKGIARTHTSPAFTMLAVALTGLLRFL